MKIEKYEITGEKLKSMPIDVRILFVQMAHLSNCISMLQKLYFYTHDQSSDEVKKQASVALGALMIRTLGGIISEGWSVMQKSFFSTKLSKKYEPKLTKEGRKSLASLKKYFSQKNLIHELRNKFSFHFDRTALENYITKIEDDRIYPIYLSENQGNSLFYLAEDIVGLAMVNTCVDLLEAEDPLDANMQYHRDLLDVSNWFYQVTHECLALITRDYLGKEDGFVTETILLSDIVRMDEPKVPYFVSKPKMEGI